MSVNTRAVAKMVEGVSVCFCDCQTVCNNADRHTHTHAEMAQSAGTGDRDTCLSLRRLVGFLSSENCCSLAPSLTPSLPLSPSFCQFLSHFVFSSLCLPCPVLLDLFSLSLPLPEQFWLSSFSSLMLNLTL